jgi:hypothetical protein
MSVVHAWVGIDDQSFLGDSFLFHHPDFLKSVRMLNVSMLLNVDQGIEHDKRMIQWYLAE